MFYLQHHTHYCHVCFDTCFIAIQTVFTYWNLIIICPCIINALKYQIKGIWPKSDPLIIITYGKNSFLNCLISVIDRVFFIFLENTYSSVPKKHIIYSTTAAYLSFHLLQASCHSHVFTFLSLLLMYIFRWTSGGSRENRRWDWGKSGRDQRPQRQ